VPQLDARGCDVDRLRQKPEASRDYIVAKARVPQDLFTPAIKEPSRRGRAYGGRAPYRRLESTLEINAGAALFLPRMITRVEFNPNLSEILTRGHPMPVVAGRMRLISKRYMNLA
jgi:hypothetical protein